MTKRAKKLAGIYKVLFDEIEHSDDLRKYGLSLSDYEEARSCFNIVSNIYKTETIYSEVAKFYKKFGFDIKQKGIGFEITC